MKTLRLVVDPTDLFSSDSQKVFATASEILRGGGVVAFPTETVYGLGANALDPQAVSKIFLAKQRPNWDPLIVHIAEKEALSALVTETPTLAQKLIDAFWPGPLTLLLDRSEKVPSLVTAGRPKVGVRMPSHPVAKELIRHSGLPIAAPSANSFGRTSPTLAEHVLEDLDGRIDAVVDSGEATYGLESTVIDPSLDPPVIYRPGIVTPEQIQVVCGSVKLYAEQIRAEEATPESLPSPGVGIRHYAPRARLYLIEGTFAEQQQQLALYQRRLGDEHLGVMLPEGFVLESGSRATVFSWGRWKNQEELAQRLFAGLRELDAKGSTVILCPLPEEKGVGLALRDRLRKAAREK